jgi:hypothetical protein
MPVTLSSLAGAGAQFFDNNGVPLAGGLIYTYLAGTNTPAATYTSNLGSIAHANPIVLDAAGRIATGEVWLTSGVEYKFVVKTSTFVQLGSYDNIPSINDFTSIYAALANTTDPTLGDALIGFKQSNAAGVLSGAVGRTVHQKWQEFVSVKDFGADSTGATSCSTVFATADASGSGSLVIPAGTYLVSTNVTFATPVIMNAGAVLNIATGVTVTFTGGFQAGVYRVFNITGTGEVVFNWQNLTVGYPEWWGAAANQTVNSYAGITASLKACKVTQLSSGTYLTDNTIKILYANRVLRGTSEFYVGVEEASRLLITSGTINTLQIGPDADPGGVALFLYGIVVENLYVGRNVAPVISNACTGLIAKFTVSTQLTNIQSSEHIYSYQFIGTVGLIATNCKANRSAAGTGAGTDLWYGYYVNGLINVGFAGGNASIYLNYCTAGCNIAALQTNGSTGFYINSGFSDTFLESPETAFCNVGIVVEGDSSTTNLASNLDLMIKNPVNDQFGTWGIYFHNINRFGSAIVNSGYYGASATAAFGIYVHECLGAVTIEAGQFVMANATTANAIGILNSNGVIVDNAQILECSVQAVGLTGSNNCDIRPLVKNYSNSILSAVQLFSTCTHNYIAPNLYGAAGLASLGVQLVGATNTYNEVNCTLINPTVLSGGSANKLNINSVSITATGLTGTNLVSGVML